MAGLYYVIQLIVLHGTICAVDAERVVATTVMVEIPAPPVDEEPEDDATPTPTPADEPEETPTDTAEEK